MNDSNHNCPGCCGCPEMPTDYTLTSSDRIIIMGVLFQCITTQHYTTVDGKPIEVGSVSTELLLSLN